jgi:hypothetical protein
MTTEINQGNPELSDEVHARYLYVIKSREVVYHGRKQTLLVPKPVDFCGLLILGLRYYQGLTTVSLCTYV